MPLLLPAFGNCRCVQVAACLIDGGRFDGCLRDRTGRYVDGRTDGADGGGGANKRKEVLNACGGLVTLADVGRLCARVLLVAVTLSRCCCCSARGSCCGCVVVVACCCIVANFNVVGAAGDCSELR